MRRLPYVVTFLFPLQSVLTALGLRHAVYVLLVGGTAAFLLRAAIHGRAASGFRPVWLFIGYIGMLGLTQASVVSLFGFLGYTQFALFWLAYAYAYGGIDVDRLTRANLAVATIIAVIGIYQYFFNPTLWGFSTYEGVEKYVFGDTLRVNSLLPSAMTLGAYLVVSALLAMTLPARGTWTNAAVAMCVVCAFLTGNKSTFFSLGAVFVYGLADRGIRRHGIWGSLPYLAGVGLTYLVLLATVDAWGPWLDRFNRTLFRVIAPFFFTGETDQVSYLFAYWRMLFLFYGGSGPAALAFGNGLGLTRQNTTFFGGDVLGDFIVAESFFVQLLFEVGIIGLLFFHVVLWRVFRRARAQRPQRRLGFDHALVALYANMIVVHVFSGVFLGFLWGYFAALLSSGRLRVLATDISPEKAVLPAT